MEKGEKTLIFYTAIRTNTYESTNRESFDLNSNIDRLFTDVSRLVFGVFCVRCCPTEHGIVNNERSQNNRKK